MSLSKTLQSPSLVLPKPTYGNYMNVSCCHGITEIMLEEASLPLSAHAIFFDDDDFVGFKSLCAPGIYGMDHYRERIGYKDIRVQALIIFFE